MAVGVEQNSIWRGETQDDISRTPKDILDVVHFYYALFIGLLFVLTFVGWSIARQDSSKKLNKPVVLGPGGKPLPSSDKKDKEEDERRKKLEDFSPGRKVVFQFLSAAVLASLTMNIAGHITHALTMRSKGGWWPGKEPIVYLVSSIFLFSILQISLVDTAPAPNVPHQVAWVGTLIGELILLAATIRLYTNPHLDINSLRATDEKISNAPNNWEIFELSIDALRVVLLLFLVGFYIIFTTERHQKIKGLAQMRDEVDENSPLLTNGQANGHAHVSSNGTTENRGSGDSAPLSDAGNAPNGTANGGKSSNEPPVWYKPTTVPNRSWWEYLKGYSLFFPYLWPAKSLKLQCVVVVCFGLVVLQRIVNLAVPLQMGRVINRFAEEDGKVPWLDIVLLVGLKLLQGTSGCLNAFRSMLWIPISQYSYQALTTASFEHVHSLSLDFHLGKRTGEVISALSKGNAINNFLEQITFQMFPMVFDLGVAVIFFGIKLDAYYALIVSIITFSYLYLTIRMARWRTKQRREMTNLSREEDAVKNDSLTSYETVKYFNAEEYEFNRYRKAVVDFQLAEYKVTVSLNILNISQNLVFIGGLLVASLTAAYQVTNGTRDVGDFVLLMTYMAQLQQPLNFFGSFYRSMQSAMISGERLLELFKEQPTVVDDVSAAPMSTCEGQIQFRNVKFSYDERKPALEDLTFTCRPGTTTAFVGESGGGKSTVFRLVYRYYNAQGGSIQVDGNDVQDITIDSLRQHIGVVPQDTILFNETLMYNLKYANQDATDEDVYEACRAASIHDKILAFPDGYQTKVGERGLRLSGGEKQRVAIARTIIKNPRIILLDEATAALDSTTEENIQEALKKLSEGRTMLVIAHRLSTISSADQILVLHAGKVAEAGTHHELLALKGKYASMWRKQIKANRAMEQATQMVAKAKALTEAVMDRPGSSGNEGGPSEDVSESEADASTRLTASKATLLDTDSIRDGASSFSMADPYAEGKVPNGHENPTNAVNEPSNAQIANDAEQSLLLSHK